MKIGWYCNCLITFCYLILDWNCLFDKQHNDNWYRIFGREALVVSSSSCHATSTDIPDLFSPPFSIVHSFWQFFKATSRIGTELLYVGSSWSSCLCSSMWRGPQECISYDFVLTSPAVSCMSGAFNFDSFCDGW